MWFIAATSRRGDARQFCELAHTVILLPNFIMPHHLSSHHVKEKDRYEMASSNLKVLTLYMYHFL